MSFKWKEATETCGADPIHTVTVNMLVLSQICNKVVIAWWYRKIQSLDKNQLTAAYQLR